MNDVKMCQEAYPPFEKPKPVKALSIKQPWAWLICAGYKDIENRTWFIGRKPALGGTFQDRGLQLPQRIYIHAGKTADKLTIPDFDAIYEKIGHGIRWHLDYGAIIGEVTITGCVKESASPWFVGPYGFVLTDSVLYDKPIPYRGQLGFFEVKL